MGIEAIWTFPYQALGDLMWDHFQQLTEGVGLTQEILELARPFSLRGRFVQEMGLRHDILDRLNLPRGYPHDLLIFPYRSYPDVFRARLDEPEKDKQGHSIRYKQPAKQRNVPYIVPPPTQQYPQIFFTEGEKKTLALAQAGCRVLGFGGVHNWRDRSSPTGVMPDLEAYPLQGETVVIAFDTDVQSNRHVQQAEDALVHFCLDLGAARVLRLRIPVITGQKIGIDDYLKDHGWAVIDGLLTEALEELGILPGDVVMSASYAPSRMLTSFLPKQGLVLVAGVPGCGKTEFLIQQAVQATQHGDVLFFLNEGGMFNLQQRQRAYCQDIRRLQHLLWARWRELDLSQPEGLLRFERLLRHRQPCVVIIDPGPDAFEEENDAAVLKEPLRRLYHFTEVYKLCLVLSWHFAKMPAFSGVYSFRGSSAIAGKVDLVYDLTLSGQNRLLKLEKLRLDCDGLRQGQRWILRREETETGRTLRFIDVDSRAAEQEEKKRIALAEAIVQFAPGEAYSTTQIQEVLVRAFGEPISPDTARRILKKLVTDGFFEVASKARGKKPAAYRRTSKVPGEAAV